MSEFLNTPETWVTLSLILFFAVLGYFGVHRIVVGALDKHADDIRARIDEAKELREAAGVEVKQRQDELERAVSDSEAVIEQARRDADLARQNALREFQQSLERRTQAAEERIRQAELAAHKELRDHAIDIAVSAATEIIDRSLTADDRKALAQSGIESVRSRLRDAN